jgi:hypothetical protein
MARINQWAFRGQILNSPYVRIRHMTGPFSLPPLKGQNFPTMGGTGELFVPKLHGPRDLQLEIIVRDMPYGIAPIIFDQLSLLFANRAQGTLANILDGGARTGTAECISWVPADMSVGGTTFVGTATFHLTDPWLYGATVTGSVTPVTTISVGAVIANQPALPRRTSYTLPISGAVAGQPILVLSYNWDGNVISGITDNFATPHTYVAVESVATGDSEVELWIGTGGTGTSGTVTVTSLTTSLWGGMAFPLYGASAGVGLAAVDTHNHASALLTATLSLTPTAANEIAIYGAAPDSWSIASTPPAPPWAIATQLVNGGEVWAAGTSYLSPANGVALPGTFTDTVTSATMYVLGAIVKTASGTAATLAVTNSGTALAEKITLDLLGPIINPTIVNSTTNTSVNYAGTVAAGTHLVIDTGAFTALNNGVNVIGKITHQGANPFLTLNPGVNNLLVYGSGCTGATLLTVSFNPPWE